MHWIIATLLMFTCSVAVYVAVRKAAIDGLPSQFNNLAMFAIPLPVFVLGGLLIGDNFAITITQAVEIATAAVVFAYLGNAFSMHSIAVAPNPGYSLLLSKSYVVFTTVWAVIFFNSPINLRSGIGIAMIVLSSALIMVRRRSQTAINGSKRWLSQAIGAFVCWGFLSLVAKHVQAGGVATMVFLSYMFAVVNVCIVTEMRVRKLTLEVVRTNVTPFLLIGTAAAGFNFFNFYAIKIAPNLGYVNAANAASIGAVTVIATALFKDELTRQKMTGVFGVLIGLLLLFL